MKLGLVTITLPRAMGDRAHFKKRGGSQISVLKSQSYSIEEQVWRENGSGTFSLPAAARLLLLDTHRSPVFQISCHQLSSL